MLPAPVRRRDDLDPVTILCLPVVAGGASFKRCRWWVPDEVPAPNVQDMAVHPPTQPNSKWSQRSEQKIAPPW